MLCISIHATHTGGDPMDVAKAQLASISIHATHTGGDFHAHGRSANRSGFQSTPPIRVATMTAEERKQIAYISIHATHTGGDLAVLAGKPISPYFNPRHPYGWRRISRTEFPCNQNFNPRHPYGWRPASIS